MTVHKMTIDARAISEHLKFIDPKAKAFAFASYTEKGREKDSNVSVRLSGTVDEVVDRFQAYQDQSAALYFSVNAMEGGYTRNHVGRIRALFIDLDNPSATLDDVMACPLPVHRIVETSPGKHQCYWLVDGLEVEEAEGFTRWLVKRFSADKGVWDAARVFRLPGSWHMKGEPFKVRVVYRAKKVRAYTIEDIDRAGVQWTPRQVRSKTTDYVPPVHVDAEKLVTLVNGSDEACLEIWDAERADFNAGGIDGSRYHMAIGAMIRKCRLPIEVFDVYLRAWAARHPAGNRTGKIDRPGYIAMTWANNTMGVALRPGETWEGWRTRRAAVMALFDRDNIADDGEPDLDGMEAFLFGASDDALAIRAAQSFKANMRYTPYYGRWHLWDGVKWTENTVNGPKDALRAFLRDEAATAEEYARDMLDAAKGALPDMAKELVKVAKDMKRLSIRLRKNTTLKDVMAMLVLERTEGMEVVASHTIWDRHDTLIGTAAGVIDLETGETLEDGRRFFCSRATLAEPAKKGTKPKRWLNFLGEVFNDDDTIEFVHRFFGYAMTGMTREDCFVFAFGDGRNGKGILTNTVADIMGAYAKTVDADTFTLAGVGQHKSGLAALQGVRFALSSEIADGAAWNIQRLKALTGGDTIEANFMRQNKFEFKPNLSLVICANEKPALKRVDNAVRARFRFLKFPNSFAGREDRGLKEALRAEYPAILRWLIDGAAKYLKDGLTYPETIKRDTDAYLDEADTLKNWYEDVKWEDEDTNPKVEEAWFSAMDVNRHYANHCRSIGVKAVGKHAVLEYLRRRGLEAERKVFKYGYKGQMLAWGPFKNVIPRS